MLGIMEELSFAAVDACRACRVWRTDFYDKTDLGVFKPDDQCTKVFVMLQEVGAGFGVLQGGQQ